MKIQRVIIHDFKALKNVDISFEKDFSPNIFPVASLNGGGKSTLLQFIFTLLHCSGNFKKHQYIRNLLDDYEIPENELGKDLATFEIWDEEEQRTIELKFICYNGKFEMSPLDDKTTYPVNFNSNYEILLNIDHNLNSFDNFMIFFRKLSNKIFLASSLMRPYLFLSKENKKLLFSNELDYCTKLLEVKKDLPDIYFYDYVGVGNLINFFTKARNNDFATMVKTGKYGKTFVQVLKDLKNFFNNIKITPDEDLTKVIFKKGDVELNPEDLSHGELMRLSIYAWIKANEMDNAIILMDEIEMGLHPDWQYKIIRDLEEWAGNSQFILATHSYEVCRALTPSHVKEIEPKLLKQVG